MALNVKNLRIAAILAIIFSISIILFAIIYPIFNKASDSLNIFLITLILIEVLILFNSILFCINPKKRVFISGILGLLALLIPGIMILIIYFNSQKGIKFLSSNS